MSESAPAFKRYITPVLEEIRSSLGKVAGICRAAWLSRGRRPHGTGRARFTEQDASARRAVGAGSGAGGGGNGQTKSGRGVDRVPGGGPNRRVPEAHDCGNFVWLVVAG